MIIVGLGGLLDDAACAVIKDGVLAAAVEQKKIGRRHRPGTLPFEAIQAALELAGATASGVDTVAIARPLPESSEGALHLQLRERFPSSQTLVVEHHAAHAASAYFASGFDRATVLVLDRGGDYRSASRWRAEGNRIEIERESYFPDSLADLYSRVTELMGHEPRGDEHKVQWMATGAPSDLAPMFDAIIGNGDSDWPRIDRSYFDRNRLGFGGFSSRFFERLGVQDETDLPESLKPRVAAGLQRAIETAVTRMAGQGDHLCLAGGLAFNTPLVSALEHSGRWKRVFVQPAAGNSGTALGAAYSAWHSMHGRSERIPFSTLSLGPSYTAEQIKQTLENCKLHFSYLLTTGEVIQAALELLQHNRIVAWMQGRMEFGPRALGNRSILASPLDPYSTENLNIFIKRRESFRKFAASVPAEHADRYFDVGPNARFLATIGRVRQEHRKTFESAILGNGLVRVHVVDKEENPLFHALLNAWGERTGLPVLYNTSFNLFGDPLVCTPRDAVRSFYSCGVDALLVGSFLLEK